MSQVTRRDGGMTILVDDEGIAQALGELRNKTPAVLKVAINRTARSARKELIAGAQSRYDLTSRGKAKVKALKMRRKATNAVLVAQLGQSDRGLPLDFAYYRHAPGTVFWGGAARWHAPEYVTGRVLKESPVRPLGAGNGKSKAFLTEFKSGHVGMVQRRIGVTYGPDNATTVRSGKPRWQPMEQMATKTRPGASGMQKAVWDLTAGEKAETQLEQEVQRRIREVMDREATKLAK